MKRLILSLTTSDGGGLPLVSTIIKMQLIYCFYVIVEELTVIDTIDSRYCYNVLQPK
jgi:hypothetical protein